MAMETKPIRINDGGGLYDAVGLIDTLLVDCNEIVKMLVGGRYLEFSAKVVEMVQKLTKLRNGVDSDIKSKDALIADLQKTNQELSALAYNIPDEKGE